MPTFTESLDAAASTGTTYTLTAGQSIQGTLTGSGDHDWYRVTLTAGQTYTFALSGTGTNNVVDTFLQLYAADGATILRSDDDGLPNYNSMITYTATTTGTYYIDAAAYQPSSTGQYEVTFGTGTRLGFDTQMGAGVIDTNYSWSATPGATATVTYGFRTTNASYSGGVTDHNLSTFSQLTASEMTTVRNTLRMWSEICNINFVEVNPGGYTDSATILFGNYTDAGDGAGAFAYYPGSALPLDSAGDVWLNTTSISTTQTLTYGSYGFFAIMHELGHAIGLSHPGLYNAAPGVSITYAGNAQFTQDTQQYTIMSYFDETSTGGSFGEYANSPMLLDIYAAQRIYGANNNTRNTNTTYGFNSNAGAPYEFTAGNTSAFCIWDGGGSDTIDASGYSQNQIINLNAESFSNIGGRTNNVSIAFGVTIENATGGSGADTITGNNAANSLRGGGGNDSLLGGNGNDFLYDGSGVDTLNGGGGFDRAVYAISSSAATVTRNSNGTVTVAGSGFTDTLTGVEAVTFSNRTVSVRERARTDLTGEGLSDLVLQNGTTLTAWTIQAAVAVSGTTLATTGSGWNYIGSGDFDGNGTTDLLVNNNGYFAAWSVSNGTVTGGTMLGYASGWTYSGAGDFNGDGTTDILLRNGSQLYAWNVANNVATGGSVIGYISADWNVVGTGDFNGDSQTDLLLQGPNGVFSAWDLVNGQFAGGATMGYASGWTFCGTGDFNQDGTSDVLLRNGATLLTWTVNNNVASSASIIGSADASWRVAGTGDFNGDGTTDIAFQNGSSVVSWIMYQGALAGGIYTGNSGSSTVLGL